MTRPTLLTTTEVAQLLRVSADTILRWCERDAFPHATRTKQGVGGHWRIPLPDVAAALRAGKVDLRVANVLTDEDGRKYTRQ